MIKNISLSIVMMLFGSAMFSSLDAAGKEALKNIAAERAAAAAASRSVTPPPTRTIKRKLQAGEFQAEIENLLITVKKAGEGFAVVTAVEPTDSNDPAFDVAINWEVKHNGSQTLFYRAGELTSEFDLPGDIFKIGKFVIAPPPVPPVPPTQELVEWTATTYKSDGLLTRKRSLLINGAWITVTDGSPNGSGTSRTARVSNVEPTAGTVSPISPIENGNTVVYYTPKHKTNPNKTVFARHKAFLKGNPFNL